jgi:thiamine-phosphate pyrophosphorylase
MRLPLLYPILDTATAARRGVELVTAAGEILEGGAEILQLRHKAFFSRELFTAAGRIAEMCRQAGAHFIVNDRADIARLLGAGVHLGQDDLTPSQARHIAGDDAIIGYSTHNEEQLRAAAREPADYLALGPIFATSSKENPDPLVGIDGLRRLRTMTERPLVAIGGITRANARSVLEAGANSVAVIGGLFPQYGSIRATVEEFRALLAW